MAKKTVAPSKSPASPGARATPPPLSTPKLLSPDDAAASTPADATTTAGTASAIDSRGFLISAAALVDVEAASTTAERAERLRNALRVRRYETNARVRVWADFLFGALRFAVDDARLAERKTLRLLTIANELFEVAVTPLDVDAAPSSDGRSPRSDGGLPTLERVYEVFSDRIRAASVSKSSAGGKNTTSDDATNSQGDDEADRFSVEEVARVVEFLSSTFFRHLRAYQRVASDLPARASISTLTPLVVETPLPPPPLGDATLA